MFSARLYIRILLQVVAIVLVAGLGVAGIVTGRAVILGFVALFIAAWLISLLVYYLNASNRRIQLFLDAIEDDESMLYFPEDIGSREQRRLHAAFNRIHMLMTENRRKAFDRELHRKEYESWDKLMHVLTHEIMNSITPIISLSETLSERGIPESLGEKEYSIMLQAMQTIHRRSKGLLGFVENYRRLTRIPTPVRTKVSVAELFTDLKKLFPEEYIHFEMPASDLYLYADCAQIEQVLINLLKNARETCERKADKEIQIKFFSKGNPTLAISDNGEGILPTVLDKIFVPFFTTKTSGSGIGLSLCKQIMALHDGSINVKSELGKGSCFVLTFPK